MSELLDTFPDVNVQPAEYLRLLGYPRNHQLSDRALELIEHSRDWYADHGSPWVYARHSEMVEITSDSIFIDGESFRSQGLQFSLQQSEAAGVFLVAVSAGSEIELEAQKRWRDEKPDEYFFLEVYGSAVVEHLVTMCGARLCAWAEPQRMAVLPHMSPGYLDWDVSQQPQLLQLIQSGAERELPGGLDVFPSGMLRPKKSLLAVFGVTRHTAHVRRLAALNPCERCSFLPCQFRRAPYQRAQQLSGITIASEPQPVNDSAPAQPALDHDAKYTVNKKALARWAAERLVLAPNDDGTIEAIFRYEGTTCTNLGRRLLFHYHVKLGLEQHGYPIESERCTPAPGDDGYTSMCRYMESAAAFDG